MKKVIKNDSVNDMIAYLREEAENNRKHEIELIQMMNFAPSQMAVHPQMPNHPQMPPHFQTLLHHQMQPFDVYTEGPRSRIKLCS